MFKHINANEGDISNKVIICGDPLRAKSIAETFLDDYKQVCNTRNMFGYTGYYKGIRISIMSHGMGIPSAGIYTYELFNNYNVDYMIRLGTTGALSNNINVRDVVLVTDSFSTTNYAYEYNRETSKIMKADPMLNSLIDETSKELNIDIIKTRACSSDCFYGEKNQADIMREKFNCNVIEMESFVVFYNAKVFNKKAACLLTVSDSLVKEDIILSDEEKERGLNDMAKLALESIIKVGE